MKKILITGGSGLIGSRITKKLIEKKYEVRVLDLAPPNIDVEFVEANLMEGQPPVDVFDDIGAVVHLAGVNIFKRWNNKTKKLIMDSRVEGTRNLVNALKKVNNRPEVLVSASAVGYYGDRQEEELTEKSSPGDDFLAEVCVNWEKETKKAENLGLRTVQIRTAPVLTKEGGLLKQMLTPYKLGLGGPLGSGNQWFPWIHIEDVVGIYIYAMENKKIIGPYNAVAPEQIRQKEFSAALAKVIHRPHFMKVPRFILKIMLGEVSEVALASQKVSSNKLLEAGYEFKFSDSEQALSSFMLQ